MVTMVCPECRSPVAFSAPAPCPNCGRAVRAPARESQPGQDLLVATGRQSLPGAAGTERTGESLRALVASTWQEIAEARALARAVKEEGRAGTHSADFLVWQLVATVEQR